MKCTVKCYYNSGFDSHNVPDSPSLLEQIPIKRNFDSVYIKQDRDVISLKIACSYQEIKDCDYISVKPESETETIYYFVLGINMINDSVAELMLQEDVFSTVGGVSVFTDNIIDGWVTRRSVSDDTMFSNTIEEDFTPRHPLEISDEIKIAEDTDSTDDVTLVGSTVRLDDLADDKSAMQFDYKVVEGGEPVSSVTIPLTPKPSGHTEITIYDDDLQMVNSLPNMDLYNLDNESVKEYLQIARSIGIESSITACYKVPNKYIEGVQDNAIKQGLLKSKITQTSDEDSISVTYGTYTPKNNKVYALFNTIKLANVSSGNESEYPIYYVAAPTDSKVKFAYFADVSPNGAPYCRPIYFRGNVYYYDISKVFLACVKGSNWQNTPITFSSNSDIMDSVQYARAQRDYIQSSSRIMNQSMLKRDYADTNRFYEVVNEVKSIGKSAYDLYKNRNVSSAIDVASNMAQASREGDIYRLNERQRKLDEHNQILDAQYAWDNAKKAYQLEQYVVVPSMMFPYSNNLQNYIGNSFIAYRIGLSNEDMEAFDKYLTLYGYKTSEPLSADCFTGRENFNYIECVGLSLGNKINIRRKASIASLFNSGVRIWHKLPTPARLTNNPIVTQ